MIRKRKKSLDEEPHEQYAPAPDSPHFRKPRRRKRLVVSLLILLVVAALGGGGYWYHQRKPKTVTTAATSVTHTTAVAPASPTTNTGLSQYVAKGSDLDLSFSYPSAWSVTPATNTDTNNQAISLASPLTTLPSASGSNVTGKVTIQIRPGNATIAELGSNAPIVPLASTQIAYSQPTANQFQYPFVSYIHFANGAKTSGVFEEVMITGSQSFAQDQTLDNSSLSGLDPIITATFYQCSTQDCTGSGQNRLSITNSTWQNTSLMKQVLTLFESFKFN